MKEAHSIEGYGLFLQGRICWIMVFVVGAIFETAWVLFAVVLLVRMVECKMRTGIAYAHLALCKLCVIENDWNQIK
jgi:hypothetical protein